MLRRLLLKLTGASPELVEMADVFHMPLAARIRYVWLGALIRR